MEIQETATAKGTIKVLIVDDDADLGMFMRLKLSMEAPHLSFAAVECGPECLEYLKSNPVDCILSDYQMPEMNGMELLLALREVGSDVPFIFVTGQGNEEVAREAFKNGAYDYFTKDIGFAHFARIINSVEQAVAQRVSEAERRRAAEALKQYQQRLQLHVKQTPLAVIDWDTGFHVVSWNPAAEKIFGYTAAEAIGLHAEFIVADSAKPHVDRVWGDLLTRSGGERSTNENVTKDGRTILCEWYNTPLIADDGRVIGVASLVHDISSSKKAEDALRASEIRFRALVENAADAFFIHDSKGRIVDVNQTACENLGYTREELLRMSVQDIEMAFVAENIAELWDKEVPSRPVTINGVHRRKDGTTFQVEVRVGLLDINGTKLMLALARDVSERKRTEGVLRESEERFRALTESTSDWIWETDSEGSYTYSSPQVKDILGYSPEEIIGKKAFDLMPSDEAGRVAAEFKKLASSMLPIEHFENINITADGRTVVLETSGVPFFDRDGRFCGYRGIDRDITERKKAEEARTEGERFLNSMFASIQDGVVVLDNDFNIIRVNPTIEGWLSVSMPLVGKKCYKAFHGRDTICENCPSVRTMKTGKAAVEVVPKQVPGGEAVGWLELNSYPMIDTASGRQSGVIEYIRDITARKQAEKDRELLLKGVSSCTEGIAFADHEDRFIYVNAAHAGMYGYSQEEMIGKTWRDLISPEMVGSCEGQLAKSLKDKAVGEFTADLPAFKKDGTTFQAEVTATSLWDDDGSYGGHVCIVRDITERKNLERQRSDFFAMVTHDLKSPLTTILGYTELISKKAKAKEEKDIAEMAKVAFQSGKKLLKLVEDFMAAARMETNGVQLSLLPEEVAGILLEVRDDFEPLAKKKRITFRFNVPDSLPRAFLDKKQVERAVGNLLQNAFNYTQKGGEVTLKAETALRGVDKYIMISVSDTGPGIPYDEREKIFNKYYRSPRTSGLKGTGLGLAIVKVIAEAHGGKVEVDSEEGRGSTFRLYLPVGLA